MLFLKTGFLCVNSTGCPVDQHKLPPPPPPGLLKPFLIKIVEHFNRNNGTMLPSCLKAFIQNPKWLLFCNYEVIPMSSHSYCDDVGRGMTVNVCECEQPPLLNISLKGESYYIGNLQLRHPQKPSGSCSVLYTTGHAGSQGQETQVQVSIHSVNLRHRVCSCRARFVFKSHLVH